MWWGVGLIATIWLFGWISAMRDLNIIGGRLFRWVIGPVILFFIWPYLGWKRGRAIG